MMIQKTLPLASCLASLLVGSAFGWTNQVHYSGKAIQRRSLSRQANAWQLQAVIDDDEGGKNNDDVPADVPSSKSASEDIEAIRKQLQSSIASSAQDDEQNETTKSGFASLKQIIDSSEDDIVLPPPPPLTSIERDRRMAEITLLGQLQDSDEPLESLWDLWFSERGPRTQERLRESDLYLSQPHRWDDAERILKELIDDHGIYFVEPINRLATLYFLQSRLKGSYRLCLVVLSIKPWHFGALSGMVAVCMGRNDGANARIWADRRLPSANPPGTEQPRRKAWIQRAVADAKASMKRAEKRTAASFGAPDEHIEKGEKNTDNDSVSSVSNIALDEDSWQ